MCVIGMQVLTEASTWCLVPWTLQVAVTACYACWKPHLCSLQEQEVLLTTELALPQSK